MKNYELTIVLAGKTAPAKKKSAIEFIKKLVKTNKGKISKTNDLGELELEYMIKGNDSGIFVNFELELDASAVKPIGDKLRLEEDILRHLLVGKS